MQLDDFVRRFLIKCDYPRRDHVLWQTLVKCEDFDCTKCEGSRGVRVPVLAELLRMGGDELKAEAGRLRGKAPERRNCWTSFGLLELLIGVDSVDEHRDRDGVADYDLDIKQREIDIERDVLQRMELAAELARFDSGLLRDRDQRSEEIFCMVTQVLCDRVDTRVAAAAGLPNVAKFVMRAAFDCEFWGIPMSFGPKPTPLDVDTLCRYAPSLLIPLKTSERFQEQYVDRYHAPTQYVYRASQLLLLRPAFINWNNTVLTAQLVVTLMPQIDDRAKQIIQSMLLGGTGASRIAPGNNSDTTVTTTTLDTAIEGAGADSCSGMPSLTSGSKLPGAETVIDERILHPDPPVRIEVPEAQAIVAEQEAGLIELQLATRGQVAGSVGEFAVVLTEQVVVVQFKRCPKELLLALEQGKALQRCRQMLESAGHNWRLPNGDMIFVPPDYYRPTMLAYVQNQCFSVLFTENFEYLIHECIADVGKGASAKARSLLDVDLNTSDFATPSAHATMRIWKRTLLSRAPS